VTSAGAAAGRVIIVCGLPGAGKTTLARRLERERPGVRFDPDAWLAALGVDLFDQAARARVEGLQWTLAERVVELGGTAIIEWGTWGRPERDALRARAREMGAAVELHVLDAPLDELWKRVRDRDAAVHPGRRALTLADLEVYARAFERPDEDELALFDPPAGSRRSRGLTP